MFKGLFDLQAFIHAMQGLRGPSNGRPIPQRVHSKKAWKKRGKTARK